VPGAGSLKSQGSGARRQELDPGARRAGSQEGPMSGDRSYGLMRVCHLIPLVFQNRPLDHGTRAPEPGEPIFTLFLSSRDIAFSYELIKFRLFLYFYNFRCRNGARLNYKHQRFNLPYNVVLRVPTMSVLTYS